MCAGNLEARKSYPENSALLDEETGMPEEVRRTWRLPENFVFYLTTAKNIVFMLKDKPKMTFGLKTALFLSKIWKRNMLLQKRDLLVSKIKEKSIAIVSSVFGGNLSSFFLKSA